jgi:hypothetical protein
MSGAIDGVTTLARLIEFLETRGIDIISATWRERSGPLFNQPGFDIQVLTTEQFSKARTLLDFDGLPSRVFGEVSNPTTSVEGRFADAWVYLYGGAQQ